MNDPIAKEVPMIRVARMSFIPVVFLYSGCAVKPPSVVPDEAVASHIRVNRANPPRIGFEYYPEASRHAGEQGVCKVSITVLIVDLHCAPA
jgi:hypothetical protein